LFLQDRQRRGIQDWPSPLAILLTSSTSMADQLGALELT
jgi:hypothetical protein